MVGEQQATPSSPQKSQKESPTAAEPAQAPVAKPNPQPNPQKEEEEEEERDLGRHGDGGSVICTEMVRQKRMNESDARASTFYAHSVLGQSFLRGYRFWAVPYVCLMRRSGLATLFVSPLVHHRTQEILYRLGRRTKGSFFGKIVCAIHDPMCMIIGNFIKDTDYKKLYKET